MIQILIIDDSLSMRQILKNLLINNFNDLQIFEADSKETALSKIKRIDPDLILLDTVMRGSESEGLETLKEIKQTLPKTIIIMLIPIGQTGIIEKCRKLGVLQYIQKPFDQDDVLKNINRFLITNRISEKS